MKRSDVLVSSRFKLPGRFLVTTRAELMRHRIEFRGHGIAARFERTIPIDDVVGVDWFTTVKGQPNLRIQLRDGGEFLVWLREAGLWCYEIRRLARLEMTSTSLPASRGGVAEAA